MIFDLAQDFHDGAAAMPREHPKHRTLELLEEAIRRDIHFIARHPTTLFQCMWNLFSSGSNGAVSSGALDPAFAAEYALLAEMVRTWGGIMPAERPWLKALLPPAVMPGHGPCAVLDGHASFVSAVKFAPSGTRLATAGGADCTVCIWDALSGELLHRLAHRDPVSSIAWLQEGDKLAIGTACGEVMVWHPETERVTNTISLPGRKHARGVTAIAEGPDDSTLVVALGEGNISVMDLRTGRTTTNAMSFAHGPVIMLELSHTATLLAVAAMDSGVKVCDVSSFRGWSVEVPNLTWCTMLDWRVMVTVRSLSPDDQRSIVELRTVTGDVMSVLFDGSNSPHSNVATVSASPCGRKIAFTSDREVRIISLDDRSEVCLSGGPECHAFSSFASDSSLLACSEMNRVHVWNLGASHQSAARHEPVGVREASVSRCGRFLAVATDCAFSQHRDSIDRSPLEILDTANGAVLHRWRGRGWALDTFDYLAWFNQTPRVAFGGSAGAIWVWEPVEDDCAEYEAACNAHSKLAVSPDDGWLACTCEGGWVDLINLREKGRQFQLRMKATPARDGSCTDMPVVFSADGALLAAAAGSSRSIGRRRFFGRSYVVHVWRPGHSMRPTLYRGNSDVITALAFSPCGSYLASGAEDGKVLVWTMKTGRLVERLEGKGGAIDHMAFALDGDTIVGSSTRGQGWTMAWSLKRRSILHQWLGAFDAQKLATTLTRVQQGHRVLLGRQVGNAFEILEMPGERVVAAMPVNYNDGVICLPQAAGVARWNAGTLGLYQLVSPCVNPTQSPLISASG